MASVDGSGPMRANITAQMSAAARAREPVDDITRHPRPADKPRPDAHWDEAAGRWEV